MIKYRTFLKDKIDAIEIERETNNFVILKGGRREAKTSDTVTWHDTWEDAYTYIVAKQQERVDALRQQLEREKGKLGQLKGMKKPKDQKE